jgi:hypothetical protein
MRSALLVFDGGRGLLRSLLADCHNANKAPKGEKKKMMICNY